MQVHARVGEILYIYADPLEDEAMCRQLHSAIRHFCRSVELCDGYLRGFYGLALVGIHVHGLSIAPLQTKLMRFIGHSSSLGC